MHNLYTSNILQRKMIAYTIEAYKLALYLNLLLRFHHQKALAKSPNPKLDTKNSFHFFFNRDIFRIRFAIQLFFDFECAFNNFNFFFWFALDRPYTHSAVCTMHPCSHINNELRYCFPFIIWFSFLLHF